MIYAARCLCCCALSAIDQLRKPSLIIHVTNYQSSQQNFFSLAAVGSLCSATTCERCAEQAGKVKTQQEDRSDKKIRATH